MGKFKSLFIQEEPTTVQTTQNVQYKQNQAAQPAQVIDQTVFVQPTVQTAQTVETCVGGACATANTNMVTELWKTIIGRNLPGPDYIELRNTVSALADLPLTEQQKVEAAFKMLAKTNPDFTKDDVLRSINTYLGIVEEEKTAGLKECANARSREIDGKKAEIASLNGQLKNIEKEIAKLTEQKDKISDSITSKTAEIKTSEANIAVRESEFLASVEEVKKTLTSDMAKYQGYNF